MQFEAVHQSCLGQQQTTQPPSRLVLGAAPRCRVLMVSDISLPGDGAVLNVRSWDAANRGDAQIAALVDALLEHLPDNFLEPSVDLRLITTRVNGAIVEAADEPMPHLVPTDSDAGYYEDYPVRPGAEVCQFFLQCGYCKCAPACHAFPCAA